MCAVWYWGVLWGQSDSSGGCKLVAGTYCSDFLKSHNMKTTSVNVKMNDGQVPFSCFSLRMLVHHMTLSQQWLPVTPVQNRALTNIAIIACDFPTWLYIICEKLLGSLSYLIVWFLAWARMLVWAFKNSVQSTEFANMDKNLSTYQR